VSSRRWAAALLVISGAVLGYELLLMRLLALAYWGHFAGLVISIAMLGLASSGLYLFFARKKIKIAPHNYFVVSAGLFGLVAPLAFLCSQRLPFTPFLLTWSAQEYTFLGARCLLFFAPFFFGGIAIGTPFVATVLPMGRLYFWNMLGSGAPALPLLLGMNFMHPMRLLVGIAAIALGITVFCAQRWWSRIGWAAGAFAVIGAVWFTPFRYSEYKELPKTLLLPEAKIIEERHAWDGVVHIVDSPHTRYLPGLSLNFAGTLPQSRLIFTDAAAMTVVFAGAEPGRNLDFLRLTPEAFSYELTRAPALLSLYGGPADLHRGQLFGARMIRIIDDSAARVAAVRGILGTPAALSGQLDNGDARQILERDATKWDVIGVSLLGAHAASTAGAASLDPSFLLTTEGCSRLFDALSPAGHAVFSTWVENPAKSGVRLISLWIETLRGRGIQNPSRYLIALRSWSTLSIFVGREPFDATAITALQKFCDQNSFDLVWFEGIERAQTNRINVIPEDPYHEAFAALVGAGREEFIRRSPFALEAPSDNAPFFNHSFRWAAVPQWLSTMGMSWLPFVEWGYILHLAALVVVTLLGSLLLIVPCLITGTGPGFRGALLFFMLGIAYMFVELWAIYKISHLVGQPLLASALVLSAMLGASGAGAALLTQGKGLQPSRTFILIGVALVGAVILAPLIIRFFLPQPLWLRAAAAVIWLIVPAFFMGFPFPYALSRMKRETDVPWALALNGFGSVLGSLLATVIALHFGLAALAITAIASYGVVALISLRMSKTSFSLTT
jgi:hypothetical protein